MTPDDYWWFGVGIFDGAPDGRTWGFSDLGREGSLTILEAIYRPAFGEGQFPGGYHLGAWYHSNEFEEIATGDPHQGNYGFFGLAEQLVWKERNDPDDDQGLAVFGQYGWAPEEWNVISNYWGTGLLYKGLLLDRDQDYFGIGIARAQFSEQVLSPNILQVQSVHRGQQHTLLFPNAIGDGAPHEAVVECFYSYEATPWMTLQPDLQYIANPSGTGRDALAVGFRFQLAL